MNAVSPKTNRGSRARRDYVRMRPRYILVIHNGKHVRLGSRSAIHLTLTNHLLRKVKEMSVRATGGMFREHVVGAVKQRERIPKQLTC